MFYALSLSLSLSLSLWVYVYVSVYVCLYLSINLCANDGIQNQNINRWAFQHFSSVISFSRTIITMFLLSLTCCKRCNYLYMVLNHNIFIHGVVSVSKISQSTHKVRTPNFKTTTPSETLLNWPCLIMIWATQAYIPFLFTDTLTWPAIS